MASSIRLFVAVNIPESMKEKIYPIGAFLPRDAVKPVEKDNLHITIKFLGEVPDFRLGDIASELEKVKFTRFNVALHGVGVFPSASNARVVWVGCESKELYHLAKKINASIVDTTSYFHHVTPKIINESWKKYLKNIHFKL